MSDILLTPLSGDPDPDGYYASIENAIYRIPREWRGMGLSDKFPDTTVVPMTCQRGTLATLIRVSNHLKTEESDAFEIALSHKGRLPFDYKFRAPPAPVLVAIKRDPQLIETLRAVSKKLHLYFLDQYIYAFEKNLL